MCIGNKKFSFIFHFLFVWHIKRQVLFGQWFSMAASSLAFSHSYCDQLIKLSFALAAICNYTKRYSRTVATATAAEAAPTAPNYKSIKNACYLNLEFVNYTWHWGKL